MDLKQLMYFIAIAEEKSYIRAAKRLNVSQPALSVAVKKLEAEVGTPLFFSFGRQRELTDAGNTLFADAKDLIVLYHRTLDHVQRPGQHLCGEVRFGLPPLMGACFFANIMPSFSKSHPNIRVTIVEEGANCVDQMIEEGDLDIALSLNTKRNVMFERQHFTTQRNLAVLHKGHPLATRKSLTVADLREERFAIFNENFVLHDRIMEACHDAGFFPKIALLTSQWDFMMEFVSVDQGISILPRPVYENSIKKDVVAIPLTDNMKYWDLIVIRNKDRYFSKACEAFSQHMINHSPEDDLGN